MKERLRLGELAQAAPAYRDRYVDYLRAYSVLVVVFGHWLGAVVRWEGDEVSGVSALDVVPGLWISTWLLQVMPLFFFVGGFSNYVTWHGLQRLGEGAGRFLSGRGSRLLRPTGVFLAFWAVLGPVGVRALDLTAEMRQQALKVLIGPLWFLGVYLVLVALSPIMVRLHDRFRLRILIPLALAPAVVDGIRFLGGWGDAGNANLLLVWLTIHQLGFFYADGTFDRVPRRRLIWMVLAGFTFMAELVQLELYPASMVGCCGDKISNMAPPTLPLLALGLWQVGLAMLLRPAFTRWLQRRRPWQMVVAVNASIMTIFLWHLSALVIAVAVLYPLGFPQPVLGSVFWWLTRPVWVAVLVTVLTGLVFLFGRFERSELDPAERYWDLRTFYAL